MMEHFPQKINKYAGWNNYAGRIFFKKKNKIIYRVLRIDICEGIPLQKENSSYR
jgi:hypothetical protein